MSDDNPYSESQFKTLKYRPDFPDRFGSIQDARSFCQEFFRWYNCEHRHTGIGLLTPETVHYDKADAVIGQRRTVLASAFETHPERFVGGLPVPPPLPEAAWINKPKVDSNKVMPAETMTIPVVVKAAFEGDRQSWGDVSKQMDKTDGNDTKFKTGVSHFH